VAFVGRSRHQTPSRDSAPGPRFVLFAVLSVVCLYYDQRDSWLQSLRYWMQGSLYPLQWLVDAPRVGLEQIGDALQSRDSLRAEVARLQQRNAEVDVNALRLEALEHENAQLRALTQALPALVTRHLAAEVISVELNPLKQRLMLNKGKRDGAFQGQAVVDARGLLGQLTRVGPQASELILLTDPEHAVPVQIARNGLRSIAVGAGNSGELLLPYLPVNSDVKAGDLLITSGLGGVFPAGYPVATVTGIKRDPVLLLTQVRAKPLATLERDRETLLLWFDPTHSAAPVAPVASDTLPQVTLGAPVDAADSEATADDPVGVDSGEGEMPAAPATKAGKR
jgi:rod shape-determining protein MreC